MKKIREYRWYIVFFLLLHAFATITDFNGLYGQDSYEYLRYTNALVTFFKTGVSPGSFFWPLLYPVLGSLLSFVIKPVFALQLISIISFIGAGVYLKRILRFLYKPCEESAHAFVFLFFLLSPYLLRASLVVMSDMLALFFLTAAYYHFLKYGELLTGKHFIVFVAFSVAAIATRYGAFVLLVVPAFVVIYTFLKNFNWKAFAISLVLVALIITPHLLLRFNHALAFINHDWVKDWSITNFFKNTFVTADGNAHYAIFNLTYSLFNLFHPAFCFAGAVLLVLSVKYLKTNKVKSSLVIRISILFYAFFLAGIPLQNLRFLLLSFPLVAIVLFPGFKMVYDYLYDVKKLNTVKLWAVFFVVAIIQAGLFCRVFMPFYHDNKIEKQISKEVLKYLNLPIYTFSVDGALKAYGVTNRIINLYNAKVDTMPSTGPKLVLFNETQFAEEWKGKNPMINWDYIQKNFNLTKAEELPEGWVLYKGL